MSTSWSIDKFDIDMDSLEEFIKESYPDTMWLETPLWEKKKEIYHKALKSLEGVRKALALFDEYADAISPENEPHDVKLDYEEEGSFISVRGHSHRADILYVKISGDVQDHLVEFGLLEEEHGTKYSIPDILGVYLSECSPEMLQVREIAMLERVHALVDEYGFSEIWWERAL